MLKRKGITSEADLEGLESSESFALGHAMAFPGSVELQQTMRQLIEGAAGAVRPSK